MKKEEEEEECAFTAWLYENLFEKAQCLLLRLLLPYLALTG